jgi:hypothetical protein
MALLAGCDEPEPTPRENPDWRPSGHPLAGVARRERLWGKRYEGSGRLVKASLYCAARFQYRIVDRLGPAKNPDFGVVPLSNEERDHLAAYLETFEGPGDTVKLSRDADVDPAFDLTGDWDRGERVWRSACSVCHGMQAEGGLGPPLSGDDAFDGFSFAEYVRSGALKDSEGWMPWFRKDRLSDQDLADLMVRWAE